MATSEASATARRRLVLLCGIAPVLFTSALALYRPAFLARLDDAAYDTLLRSVPAKPPADRVAIVDVDERSLSTVGQWPWRRDLVARLITRLRDAGASAIALDIIFAEPDRDSAPGASSTPDDALARTLAEGRVVLGYAMTFEKDGPAAHSCVLHPIGLAVLQAREETGDAPYFHATGAVCSLPLLAQAAGASGFLNAAPDADGILRRAPLLVELGGRVYPALSLAAVNAVTGTHDLALRISHVNASSLMIDGRTVPLDGKANLLLRYRGKKRAFPYVSAADVMAGQVPASALRDKIVLVGTTALGTREVVATALDTLFAGVEVQATVADNLLQQDYLRRSELGASLESLAVLIVGVAVAAVLAMAGAISGAVGTAGGIAAVWIGVGWLLARAGIFVSPVLPTMAVAAELGIITLARFMLERERAEQAGQQKTNAQRLMVSTLLSLTETRDAETGRHSRRTQLYARVLAEELSSNPKYGGDLTPDRIELLSTLAPLHDIGKVGIPDEILNKPGALTAEELKQMRQHPVLGYNVILKAEKQVGVRDDTILAMAKDIVYTHHEKWDGTGYPRGLRGEEIPLPGRVMAVVDVYDALVGRALYQPARSHDDAVGFIVKGKGTHFDPAIVDAFVRVAPVMQAVAEEEQRR